jgi:hypothetical protein
MRSVSTVSSMRLAMTSISAQGEKVGWVDLAAFALMSAFRIAG